MAEYCHKKWDMNEWFEMVIHKYDARTIYFLNMKINPNPVQEFVLRTVNYSLFVS